MSSFEENKANIHDTLINLDEHEKAKLIASCSLQGIEVEKLEDTMATLVTGIQKSLGGLLEKNSNYLANAGGRPKESYAEWSRKQGK